MATNSNSGRVPEGGAQHTQAPARLSDMRIPVAGESKFRLVAELGRGGMGNVYLAVVSGPAGFNKLQVVKRLRPELAQDTESVTMFLDEARLAARLSHPNVVQTNEVGEEGGHYFIAMEYLEGQSLDHLVRRAAKATPAGIPLGIHLRIVYDALAGLHHAHELHDFDGAPLGLVHRDVTPQNIFVTYDGIAKLLDFGIAKAATSAHETRAGTFKGKCAYMPPEQIVGDAIDRRADLFSVGAVLWQVATGERLWKGESDMRIFTRVVNGDIPTPRSINPDVPPQLEAIVMRALSPKREDRFSNALEMQAALEDFIEAAGLRTSDREVGRFVTQLFVSERAAMKTAVDTQLRELARSSETRQPVNIPVLTHGSDDPGPLSSNHGIGSGPRDFSAHGSLKAVVAAPTMDSSAPPPSPIRTRVFMLGFALVAGLGTYAFGRMQADTPKATVTAAATQAPAAPPPVAIPAPAATPEQELIAVHLSATPGSARLYLDDAPLTANPVDNRFVRDGAAHVIRAEAPGFKSKSQLVSFKSDRVSVSLNLDPEPTIIRRAVPPPPPRPAPPPVQTARPLADPTPRSTAPKSTIDTSDPWQ